MDCVFKIKMKKTAIVILLITSGFLLQAQRLTTNTGKAIIYSHTVAEDIRAENTTVSGIIDPAGGDLLVSVPVQGFVFEKSLMQEHFNGDRFMDSRKFPRIIWKGKIADQSAVNFLKPGTYEVPVQGELTIKGVSRPSVEKATVTVSASSVTVQLRFIVKDISGYGVGKPMGGKKNNVADDIEVTYAAVYEKS